MSATVLIADDDRVVLFVLEQILRDAGYGVLLAQDGLEAIELLQSPGTRIDVAVLDLVMPHADGVAVLDAIDRLRPGLPVVISSGYSEEYVRSRIAGWPRVGFLAKPWQPPSLLAMVAGLLGAGPT